MRCLLVRTVALAAALSIWSVPGRADAQAADAGPAAPRARGKAVVVCDAADTATDNSRMRAGVYDVARKRGFESEPRADVPGAARAASAMEGGRISSATAPLQALRKQLGVAVVIRVALEWDRGDQRGIRVTVVSEAGDASQVVAAPAADPRPLVAKAAGELLDQAVPATAAPASAPAPAAAPEAGVKWLVQPGAHPPPEDDKSVDPKEIRRRWEARGGARASYEARAMLTGVLVPGTAFSSTNPVDKTKTDRGSESTLGIGGGLGVRVALMYLPLPDPALASGTFAGIRLGVGADADMLYVREPVGFTYHSLNGKLSGQETKYANRAWMYAAFPAQLGFELGIGSYRTPTIWRGVMLGLAYSPTWFYRLDIQSLNGEGKLNYAGFEANLDLASFEATRAGNSESQIRLFAYVLPRVKSDLPWLMSLGIGAVWY